MPLLQRMARARNVRFIVTEPTPGGGSPVTEFYNNFIRYIDGIGNRIAPGGYNTRTQFWENMVETYKWLRSDTEPVPVLIEEMFLSFPNSQLTVHNFSNMIRTYLEKTQETSRITVKITGTYFFIYFS